MGASLTRRNSPEAHCGPANSVPPVKAPGFAQNSVPPMNETFVLPIPNMGRRNSVPQTKKADWSTRTLRPPRVRVGATLGTLRTRK